MAVLFEGKFALPDAHWLERADRENDFTPDAALLEQHSHHLLFAPGETKRCGFEHERLSNGVFKGEAFTRERFFHWKRNLGLKTFSIPLLADQKAKSPLPGFNMNTLAAPARIKSELYLVPTNDLFLLDKTYWNGYVFTRQRIKVMLPYRVFGYVKERSLLEKRINQELSTGFVRFRGLQILDVWMYQAIPLKFEEHLDAGFLYSPVKIFHPRRNILGDYSCFTGLEYNDLKGSREGAVPSML